MGKRQRQTFLSVHDVSVIVAWHHGMSVTDDEALASLLRLEEFVKYAIAVLVNEPPAFDGGDEQK